MEIVSFLVFYFYIVGLFFQHIKTEIFKNRILKLLSELLLFEYFKFKDVPEQENSNTDMEKACFFVKFMFSTVFYFKQKIKRQKCPKNLITTQF